MANANLDKFQMVLTKHGYRLTSARQVTFQLLDTDHPQTMADIIAHAQPAIDRVTVYRNIELFEKLGIVHRIMTGWKYKLELSDDFISHHHHMSCSSCGKLIDIADNDQIEAFINVVSKKHQFIVHTHSFEIEGTCNDCGKTSIVS